jgi:pimeloyl-ACP methyl ester carboxylesterase
VPRLRCPDGVELHWEERGEGPLVILAGPFFGYPEVFEDLLAELARDHRVVVYHVRGTGSSSREGPYDPDVDAADLALLMQELGEPAVLLASGDGTLRAVRAFTQCPDLVVAVVSPGGNPLGRRAARDTEGLAGSDSVIDALIGMMEVDYRSALHTMLATANPQLDEDEVRARLDRTVEHCPREAVLPRMRRWVEDNATEETRALGQRFWLLEHGLNPWFMIDTLDVTRELLPEAHIEQVEDGPLSRPDITAGVVRRLTAGERATSAPSRAP